MHALEARPMDGISLPSLLIWYVVFLFSTTFHEFFHAFVGFRLGDTTAHSGGQVTLDPIPHMRRSVFGMVVWPILSFFFSQGRWMFGWASAPYDRNWALRFPRRYALMSLSGPIANFLLVLLGVVAIRVLVGQNMLDLAMPPRPDSLVIPAGGSDVPALAALSMALSVLVTLNVVLGVFNLIPVPPLDGFGVLEGLAPRGNNTFFQIVRMTPAYQFLGMILAWRFGDILIQPALNLTLLALYV
jgi:Zn-dependent protease